MGNKLNNPYTVANMQQAHYLLYGINKTLVANYLYVRFKPTNSDQLEILEDNEDLELQDYPMDFAVIQDGDYYQDPNLAVEDIPWLYSVVPAGYVPPNGIQYEVITPIYIPNNNLLLEDMAESIAAGGQYEPKIINGKKVIVRTDIKNKDGGPIYIWPMDLPDDPCKDDPLCGGGGNLPDYSDPNIPQGTIKVQEITTCNAISNVPVKQVRVVCKRWFKIDKMYTDDQGHFISTKRFKHKVKVIVKTKNNNAKVSKIRGVRYWQILFPVKKRIGVFNQGDIAAISFTFTKPANTNAHDPELPYWVAATTHNSVIEFKQYATEMGLPQPPSNLKILITNWGGGFRATGIAPMFNKCNGDMTPTFATFYLAQSEWLSGVGSVTKMIQVLKNRIDVIIDYLAPWADYSCTYFNSPWLKQLTYHELGHAQHFVQAGCDFWKQFRGAILNEFSKLDQMDYQPYGTGNDPANAPIIATAEMWGYYCEHVFANRHYNNAGGLKAILQGQLWYDNPPLKCYLNAIENFDPNYPNDKWRWIPKGLPYDLMDDRNDGLPVIDNVKGYTNQQIFKALQPNVRSIPLFKNRLLQQNNNNQLNQINTLFNEYHY